MFKALKNASRTSVPFLKTFGAPSLLRWITHSPVVCLAQRLIAAKDVGLVRHHHHCLLQFFPCLDYSVHLETRKKWTSESFWSQEFAEEVQSREVLAGWPWHFLRFLFVSSLGSAEADSWKGRQDLHLTPPGRGRHLGNESFSLWANVTLKASGSFRLCPGLRLTKHFMTWLSGSF